MPYFYVNIIMLTDVTDTSKTFTIFDYLSRYGVKNLRKALNVGFARIPAKPTIWVNTTYLLVYFVQLNGVFFYVRVWIVLSYPCW